MAHNHQKDHHHPATNGLVTLFTKANHDLSVVHNKLEKEFQQIYPDNANPMKLVSRIKWIQEEVSLLKEQCHELLAAKQDLVDKAQAILIGNRNLLKRMQTSVGMPQAYEDDAAFTNFKQIIDEWKVQSRSRTEDDKLDPDSDDVNKLLFSAIVPAD